MNKLWPFRSMGNFAATIMGISGVGLIYYSISNQRVFSNSPVVAEGVKLLSHNDTLRNLLGNPVMYNGSFSNTYSIGEEQQYYFFEVKGSKTKTTAQLNATRIKVADLKAKINKSKELKKLIEQKKNEVEKLLLQSKKMKKQQKVKTLRTVENINNEITAFLKQYEIAEKDRLAAVKKYYIPTDELYNKVSRSKTPSTPIDEKEYLYGIDGLVANLPNKNRVTIVPSVSSNIEGEEPQPAKFIIQNDDEKYINSQLNEGYVQDRMKQGLGQLTEQEIESYGKHKTQMMYGKYNGYRIGFMMSGAIALTMVLFYWHKNRLLPIGGTLIAFQAEKLFMSNPKIVQVLKGLKKSKKDIKFSKTFLGGKSGDSFKSTVDVEGLPGGKASFEGNYQSSGDIKFSKFTLQYHEANQIKKVDLLV